MLLKDEQGQKLFKQRYKEKRYYEVKIGKMWGWTGLGIVKGKMPRFLTQVT